MVFISVILVHSQSDVQTITIIWRCFKMYLGFVLISVVRRTDQK